MVLLSPAFPSPFILPWLPLVQFFSLHRCPIRHQPLPHSRICFSNAPPFHFSTWVGSLPSLSLRIIFFVSRQGTMGPRWLVLHLLVGLGLQTPHPSASASREMNPLVPSGQDSRVSDLPPILHTHPSREGLETHILSLSLGKVVPHVCIHVMSRNRSGSQACIIIPICPVMRI